MIDLGDGVQLVTRAEWGARDPKYTTAINPTYGSTSHWEGPHMGPFPHESCATKVRGIQAFHMDSRGWADIAYTYLVCPHGYVFEGRGIGHRTAANGTNIGNQTAYAVCYLGGEGDGFTTHGARAMRKAGDRCRAHGAGPNRNGHRDWKPTQCPGDDIYQWVHAGQPVGPAAPPEPLEWDEMADEQQVENACARALTRILTQRGHPARTAIRDLARMGDADHPEPPARIVRTEDAAWWVLGPNGRRHTTSRPECRRLVDLGLAAAAGTDSNGDPVPYDELIANLEDIPVVDIPVVTDEAPSGAG